MCGQAGCAAIGMAFVAAILILLLIGWIYIMWQNWAVRNLEEIEQDIRRTRWLREMEESESESSDEKAPQ
jgi:uncharacterized membrane protein YdjX (TVP38/TMEM64 family)